MMYQLLLEWTEKNTKKKYAISSQKPTKIGRDHTPGQCDLIINPHDLNISRVHIEIFFDRQKNNFLLQNLANHNPMIKINGTPFTHSQIPLGKDTAITLGNTMIKVVDIVPIITEICIKYYENNMQKQSISAQSIALGRHLPTIQQKVPNNNITPLEINNPCISSYHALIELENGALFITDQNSTNGTFINDNKQNAYTKVILKNGDNLKLGKVDVEGKVIITQNEMIIEIHNNQNQQPQQIQQIQQPPKPKQIKINLYDVNGQKISSIFNPPIAIGRELNYIKSQIQNHMTPMEINHASLSRYHALIDIENGELVITDQNSSNGTFVNNKKQNKTRLKPGDNLTLGIIESQIKITQNEMIIEINNNPATEPGLKCPKCQKTVINKTRNDFCPYCGHFLGTALSMYIPKQN